jgi:hypothetical protein
LPNTNNACWSVNLRYGTYRLDFEGFQFPKPLIFQVPNDTNTYSLLALAGLSPTNFIVASTTDFVQRNSGTGTNLTLTTPLNLTGSTFLVRFTEGGSSLTMKSSGNFHWRGTGLFDEDLHGGNGVYADAGPISGLAGLMIDNPVGNIINASSNLTTVATLDQYGVWTANDYIANRTVNATHFIGGTNPPVSIVSGSIGSGSIFLVPSIQSDSSFSVSLATGNAAGTNDIFYVTYGTPYTSANGTPIVTFSPASADAAALSTAFVDDNASNTGFIFRATLQNNKSYKWNFHVIQ